MSIELSGVLSCAMLGALLSAVKFSSVPWPIGSSGEHEGRFSRDPLPVFFCRRPLSAVLAWAKTSALWCSPSSISSADHGVAHRPSCSEGWFWRGCRGVWHVWTMQVSASLQLSEEVPVDPQGGWSCSAPSRWSCAPSRSCGKVSSGTSFPKVDTFFSESKQAGSMFNSHRGGW